MSNLILYMLSYICSYLVILTTHLAKHSIASCCMTTSQGILRQGPVQPRHGHTAYIKAFHSLPFGILRNWQDFGMKLDIFTYNTFARTLDAWQMASCLLFEILQPDLITFNSVMRLGSWVSYPSPLWKRMEKACVFWMTASSFFFWTVAFRNSVLAIACAMVELRYRPLSDFWVDQMHSEYFWHESCSIVRLPRY